jgi:hypothetical protein
MPDEHTTSDGDTNSLLSRHPYLHTSTYGLMAFSWRLLVGVTGSTLQPAKPLPTTLGFTLPCRLTLYLAFLIQHESESSSLKSCTSLKIHEYPETSRPQACPGPFTRFTEDTAPEGPEQFILKQRHYFLACSIRNAIPTRRHTEPRHELLGEKRLRIGVTRSPLRSARSNVFFAWVIVQHLSALSAHATSASLGGVPKVLVWDLWDSLNES